MKHTVAVDNPPQVKPPFRPITIAFTFVTREEALAFLAGPMMHECVSVDAVYDLSAAIGRQK